MKKNLPSSTATDLGSSSTHVFPGTPVSASDTSAADYSEDLLSRVEAGLGIPAAPLPMEVALESIHREQLLVAVDSDDCKTLEKMSGSSSFFKAVTHQLSKLKLKNELDSHQGLRRLVVAELRKKTTKFSKDYCDHMALESTPPTNVEIEILAKLLNVYITIVTPDNTFGFGYFTNKIPGRSLYLLNAEINTYCSLEFKKKTPEAATLAGKFLLSLTEMGVNLKTFFSEDFSDALRGLILLDFTKIVWSSDKMAFFQLCLADFLTFIRAFSSTVAPVFLSEAIESVGSPERTSEFSLFGYSLGFLKTSSLLYGWVACLGADKIIRAFNEILVSRIQMSSSKRLFGDDDKLLDKLHRLTYEEFQEVMKKTSPAAVASIIARGSEEMSGLISKHVHEFTMLIGTLIFSVTMLATEKDNTISAGGTSALIGFVVYNMMARLGLAYFQRNFIKVTRSHVEEFADMMVEDLRNEDTSRLYIHEQFHKGREVNMMMKMLNHLVDNFFLHSVLQFAVTDLILFCSCILTIYAEKVDRTNLENIDEPVLLINYFFLFYILTQTAGNNFIAALSAVFNIKRVEEIINNPNVESDEHSGNIVLGAPIVEFRNVTYIKDGKTLLDDISFKVMEDESCAFVGHSGSGKTTIIRLLCRLYKPTKGEILINGRRIDKMGVHELRQLITYIASNAPIWASRNDDLRLPLNVLYGHLDDDDFLASFMDRNEKQKCRLFVINANEIDDKIYKKLKHGSPYVYAFLNDSLVFMDIHNKYSYVITNDAKKIADLKLHFKLVNSKLKNKNIIKVKILNEVDLTSIEAITTYRHTNILKEHAELAKLYEKISKGAKINNLNPSLKQPSDGERQRVGLARGWRKTDIVILDEPTSAMDSLTEASVIRDFDSHISSNEPNGKKVKALFVTAHRLSTVKKCDKIFLMEDGNIINHPLNNDGAHVYTHEYLYENNERYKEYFDAQQGPDAPSFSLKPS